MSVRWRSGGTRASRVHHGQSSPIVTAPASVLDRRASMHWPALKPNQVTVLLPHRWYGVARGGLPFLSRAPPSQRRRSTRSRPPTASGTRSLMTSPRIHIMPHITAVKSDLQIYMLLSTTVVSDMSILSMQSWICILRLTGSRKAR